MDAADVLYGVSMGGDGVTKVVSRRLPREIEEGEEGAEVESPAPPPFAGVADEEPSAGQPAGLLGEHPATAPPRDSAEAA
jgi:hypothetical protein